MSADARSRFWLEGGYDSDEARVLLAIGIPRHAIPEILTDDECRPLVDQLMSTIRAQLDALRRLALREGWM